MDPERQRIQDDLRGLVAGEVRCDDVFVQLFASDASLYELKPLAVVRPRTTADVSAVVRYAAEKQIPVHARGAGTGLSGESLGRGIIVDFSRYMRRILRTDGDAVRVQPGLVLSLLNQYLSGMGRLFGPDPANSNVTTIGSVIAIDGSGSYWPKYGSARQHVLSLQVVLADGAVVELGREALDQQANSLPAVQSTTGNGAAAYSNGENELSPAEARKRDLVQRLASLLKTNSQLIAAHQPKSLVNTSGYQLTDVLNATHLDMARLLCGSEGTLALVTEATLATQPLPRFRAAGMLFFDRLEKAALAVQEVLPFHPAACDLLDRRHLSLARETSPEYEVLIPAAAEAVLLLEYSGDDAAQVRQSLTGTVDRVRRKTQLAFDARQAFDSADVELYWQLARRVVPTLHRLKGSVRPVPIVEDVAVPPAQLPDFLVRLQNTLKRLQITASLYGHASHGQLHVRPFIDLSQPDDVAKLEALAPELYAEVFAVGGTISGEHGDGFSRTPFIRQQYGPLYDVFREVKNTFDPLGILNPGKIVTDAPASITGNLRPAGNTLSTNGASAAAASNPETTSVATEAVGIADANKTPQQAPLPQPVELHLNWNLEQLIDEAQRCNGCGACRSQLPDVRMCPIFRVLPAEEASPRAKANLLRAALDGRFDPQVVASDDFKAISDLCVNCHQCRLECPAGIDVPKLMIEAKATYVDANGLRPSQWLLARFDRLSRWGTTFSPVANWAVSNRIARWVLEKTLGIAQGRKLPRFARRSFMRRATRRRLTRPTRRSGRKVLYFVDTYANYHDPQLADAFVAVMEHNGVAVYVHPGQKPSGMGLITMGSLGPARRLAAHNLHLLADAVRQGYHIVATEPSTVLCLTHEYLNLIGDDDARVVAANTTEACTYLWQLHQQGKLQLDLKPLPAAVGYHQPCHIRALGVGSPSENLLRLIPGMAVQRIERGCSGMAGLWGLRRENYRMSLRAGWNLISRLRDPALQAGTTECSACKIQMEQGTAKPTIHPLKLLALSYGLMPEISRLLTERSGELVVT
jgi:FAD/FMN-containing dehydrogenase/Fe-S oxidoreductase